MNHSVLQQAALLSLRGRLAFALQGLQNYCMHFRLDHPEVQRFIDYLWRFLPVNSPDQLHQWEAQQPQLVSVAIGDDYPDDVAEYLTGKGVDPSEFRDLLTDTFDIIYGSLYAGTDEVGTMKDLANILTILERYHLAMPDSRVS